MHACFELQVPSEVHILMEGFLQGNGGGETTTLSSDVEADGPSAGAEVTALENPLKWLDLFLQNKR